MESSEFTAWCFSRIHPSANPQALISFPISDRNGQRGRRVPPTVSTYACRMGKLFACALRWRLLMIRMCVAVLPDQASVEPSGRVVSGPVSLAT